ncbi:MAG: hypothetical protein JXR58_13390 [Bacteroidales bacterium]|nr:hypothetical protein [Bacteroidales bacterium]
MILILAVLTIPGLLYFYPLFEEKGLRGDFVPAKKPEFSLENWFAGKFQAQAEEYVTENIGFHNFLVRLNNQMNFSFFSIAATEGVVVGKENQMYEKDYILEYTGEYFIGDVPIEKKVKQIKFLQDHLLEKYNKHLVIVFEPGKAEVMPEFIPDRYHPERRTRTNYQAFLDFCNKNEVKYLDLNRFFIDIKDTVSYPLYPRYGIHWSIYGMSLAADTLVKYLEHITQKDLIDVKWEIKSVSSTPKETDYDVGESMNLLWNVNRDEYAYPVGIFEQNPEKWKPRVLAIADSYYFNIYSSYIPENVFANRDFWYFGKRVFPISYKTVTTIKEINAEEAIQSQDIILCMVTGRFLHRAFWEKINMMYKIYNPDEPADALVEAYDAITAYDEWFQKIYKEAKEKKMPFHILIGNHAQYSANKGKNPNSNNKQEKVLTRAQWLEIYVQQIKDNPTWLKKVEEKAKEQNISLDEMIKKDANWCLEDDLKNGKIKIAGIEKDEEIAVQAIIKEIKKNPKWLKHIEEKAKKEGKNIDEAIRDDAVWTYKDRQKGK